MTVLESFRLDGRVALVTGASSGLGVAIAVGLAEAGCDVVVGARRVDRLAETVAAIEATGRQALAVATDVSKPEDCAAMVDAAMEHFGRVDILVNNAGIGTAVPATKETPEQFREVIDINLSGCYWMAQACGKVMQPGSSVINISSVLALTTAGLPQAAYAASKSGLLGLTRDLAQQWARREGIRVNAIAPGFFASEQNASLLYNEDGTPTARTNKILAATPMGRFGDSEKDLVGALLFLLNNDAAGFITGICLPIDGGFSAYSGV